MGIYRTKITDYGYKERVTVYNYAVTYDEANPILHRQKYMNMSDEKKKKSDERRIRYYKQKVSNLIETALMNTDLNVAITLTFEEDVTSYDMAIAKWQLFLKRLRHVIDVPLKYICVWEYQKKRSKNLGIQNGGVFHFHCLMNLGFIKHSTLTKLWGNGYVWIDKLKESNRRNAVFYTMKYIIKEVTKRIETNEDIRGQRFFFTSNNLLKPTNTVLTERISLEDVIIQNLENMITDGTYEIRDGNGKLINSVSYVEYNK